VAVIGARPFTVREANRKDVPAVAALWQEMMDFHRAFDDRFQFAPNVKREVERHLVATIRSHGARIFVAEAQGRVVGYILGEVHIRKPIYPPGTYGFISDISVTAEWRKQGVGRALVEALMGWLKRSGVTAVELFVAEANPISQEFWERVGFKQYLRLLRYDKT
jgi:ribosomal protein S18 acetylase RimI-like enzyme